MLSICGQLPNLSLVRPLQTCISTYLLGLPSSVYSRYLQHSIFKAELLISSPPVPNYSVHNLPHLGRWQLQHSSHLYLFFVIPCILSIRKTYCLVLPQYIPRIWPLFTTPLMVFWSSHHYLSCELLQLFDPSLLPLTFVCSQQSSQIKLLKCKSHPIIHLLRILWCLLFSSRIKATVLTMA